MLPDDGASAFVNRGPGGPSLNPATSTDVGTKALGIMGTLQSCAEWDCQVNLKIAQATQCIRYFVWVSDAH